MVWVLGDGGGSGGRRVLWLLNNHGGNGGGRGIKDLLKKLKEEKENKDSDE